MKTFWLTTYYKNSGAIFGAADRRNLALLLVNIIYYLTYMYRATRKYYKSNSNKQSANDKYIFVASELELNMMEQTEILLQ